MLYTTLKLLRQNNFEEHRIATLQESLPNATEETLIPLDHIMYSNGLHSAIWALRATTLDTHKIASRMAIEFVRESLFDYEEAFSGDKRPRMALDIASSHLNGKATVDEVQAAGESSWAAWSAVKDKKDTALSVVAYAAAQAAFSARAAMWSVQTMATTDETMRAVNEKIFLRYLEKYGI